MSNTKILGAVTLAVIVLVGCSSTSFISAWKEPLDGPIDYKGKRVAAVVIHPDGIIRRSGESALAREISKRGAEGVPANSLYQGDPPQDEDTARRILQDANIEGAVVMHAVGSDKELSYNPGTGPWYSGPYYGSFYGYWGYGWGAAYSPGYLRTDTIVYVETMIYSVADNKLLWAGRSKSTNPSDVEKLVHELSREAVSEMKKSGFIS